jgi:hypothetical protein
MNPEEATTLEHHDAEKVLSCCLQTGKNVLLMGGHGTGKTSLIQRVAENHGLRMGDTFVYLSGATLDPWVDFVGVPRPDGEYLKFYRPKYMDPDRVELLVIDEINRSHQKVRNACMEMAQFKTVNGVHFPRLRAVWACGNPADPESGYTDVETLDVALADRFHFIIRLPSDPDPSHFRKIFGSELGSAAVEWWESISPESKKKVSPRRLEYAVHAFGMGVVAQLALPGVSESAFLGEFLQGKDPLRAIKKHIADGDINMLAEAVLNSSSVQAISKLVSNDKNGFKELLSMLPAEHCVALASRHDQFRTAVGLMYSEWWAYDANSRPSSNHAAPVIHGLACLNKNENHKWARKLVCANEPGGALFFGSETSADKFGKLFAQRYRVREEISRFSLSMYDRSYASAEEEDKKKMKNLENLCRKNPPEDTPKELEEMVETSAHMVVSNAKSMRRALTRWVLPKLEKDGYFGRIVLREPCVLRGFSEWQKQEDEINAVGF